MSKSTTLKHTLRETDLLLYITCILTSAFGALMVYSATMNAAAKSGLTLSRDCLIMICASALGIILCAFISLVEYNAIISLWPIAGGVCLLLLPLIAGGPVNSDAPRAAVYALCFADPFAWMAADAVLLVPFLRNIMKMDYRYLKGTV